jgi:hypothetical protein
MSLRRSSIADRRNRRRRPLRLVWLTAVLALPLGASGCGPIHHLLMGGTGAVRPPAEAFGMGPRSSESGLYEAALDPGDALRPREMRTIHAVIRDASGRPVKGATVTVDGGMPEHNHGLPTRPRVSANSGDGVYEIQGVRFNMGGWWEFRLSIDGPAGLDTVTFHLDLRAHGEPLP